MRAPLRLFHRTTEEAAAAILTEGFRDATDYYMADRQFSGVWLSNIPLDSDEGPKGKVLLEVNLDLAEEDIANYEWVEAGKPYREWLVPAALINPRMSVRVVPEDEEMEMLDPRFPPA